MEIKLSLTVEEINGILSTLGELPTKSGAYPLLMKIKTQADIQIKSNQEEENNG